MAQVNNTPVPYWLALPLPELTEWIKASNRIQQEREAERKKKRK